MKKILFATTALVASTGFAMADVDVTGSAEMGVFGGDNFDGSDQDAQFHTDINVIFTMSGETDAGLTFGAFVELDSDVDNNLAPFDPAEAGDDTAIFVSGALGTLTMGDTDGALDFALSELSIGASIQDNEEHFGWNGNSGLDGTYDGQVARYDYAIGGFSIAASAEIDDDPDTFRIDSNGNIFDDIGDSIEEIEQDTVLGIGARYDGTFNNIDFGAGIGYQRAGMSQGIDPVGVDGDGNPIFSDTNEMDAEVLGLSLDMSMDNGLSAIVNYSNYDNVFQTSIGDFAPDDGLVGIGVELDEHYGLAVGYEFGAFLVSANYGKFEYDGAETSGYGLIANYDLGGGAELQAGYAHNDYEAEDAVIDGLTGAPGNLDQSGDFDTYSFGIAMNF